MRPATSCPDTQKLQQFVLGRVSPEELDELAAHVEHCRRCIATLHSLTMQNPYGQAGPVSETDANNLLDQLKRRLRKPAIAVRCHQCGKDLKVKEDLAGKKVRCPQCRQVLDVPAPEGATLAPRGPAVAPIIAAHVHDTEDEAPRQSGPTEMVKTGGCLEVSSEIARGGMGAIMRAIDQDIHREVAVKFLLNHADSHQKARFVEEAQITGQLEHPNIVPIHQLGVHEDGRCFFSMKMVKGRSLAEILKQQGEPGASATGGESTLGRLLTIFAGVCNGMAYAHSRQVIHRDLKPANIMVGDFGEVYVMDWGLAKVLGQESIIGNQESGIKSQRSAPTFSRDPKGSATDSKTDSKVTTNRSSTGELTQAGSIMGTPAYMSPEQAQGDPDRIDERTDVYALGAILYEILTLTPPVGRSGDIASILMRVIDGKIDPPEERSPERVKAGWIQPELSAIAMKALAKKRKDRYQTVAELQRDIQLYQEGRSVSAKQDSALEMFKKLVKRNKGVSIATAAALVVLLAVVSFFLKINYDEQKARRDQGKKSAPLFVADAHHSVRQKKLDYALVQLDVALDFDPDLTEARLLKGQVLIGQKKFADAQKSLARYLERQPDDAAAKKLVELCRRPDLEDATAMLEFSEALSRQKAFALSEVMLGHAGDLKDLRQRTLKLYQTRLDAAWPGAGAHLTIDGDGNMNLNLHPFPDLVTDLAPLQGMQLNSLNLSGCDKVVDLMPLQGMPLKLLNLYACEKVKDLAPLKDMKLTNLNLGAAINSAMQVSDLTPLRGMNLTFLNLYRCGQVKDLSPLQGMPLTWLNLTHCVQVGDLTPLKGMKLTTLNLDGCVAVADLSPIQGMPLTSLTLMACSKVRDLTPLSGLKLTNLNLGAALNDVMMQVSDLTPLRGMNLTSLSLYGCNQVKDLSPLQGMPLTTLDLRMCEKVSDLSPLRGMKLTDLHLEGCNQVTDLSTLKDMPLTFLGLSHCEKVSDLSPLQGMKLTGMLDLWDLKLLRDLSPLAGMQFNSLIMNGCEKVADLTPLQGMPLTTLYLKGCSNVSDLSPLRGMKLTGVYLDGTKVTDLSPLEGMKLTDLTLVRTPVRDLRPIKGMPLTSLEVPWSQVVDLTPIRGMPLKSLDINYTQVTDLTPLEGMKLEIIYIPPMVTKGMEVLRRMSSLKTIAGKPAAQFWKEYDAQKAGK